MSAIWEQGRRDGEADARNAWCGLTWKRRDTTLPFDHNDRQDYLMAYAQGFSAYNLSIHNRYEHVDDPAVTAAMRAERGRGRERLRPSSRTSTRVIAPKGGTP